MSVDDGWGGALVRLINFGCGFLFRAATKATKMLMAQGVSDRSQDQVDHGDDEGGGGDGLTEQELDGIALQPVLGHHLQLQHGGAALGGLDEQHVLQARPLHRSVCQPTS